jgi:4-hydroxybenzoate polyprenyltransferase
VSALPLTYLFPEVDWFPSQGWGSMMAAYALRLPVATLVHVIPLLWLGCALLHSAACTINDILDREVDRLVGRYLD